MAELTEGMSQLDTEMFGNMDEVEELKIKAVEACIAALGQPLEVLDTMSSKDVDEILTCIVQEKENMVDYKDFFTQIQKRKAA